MTFYGLLRSFSFLCIVGLCIVSNPRASAQQQSEMRGIVIDDSTLKVVKGVTVLLKNMSDGSFIQGTRTNVKGEYSFHLSAATKNMILQTQRLGYASIRRELLAGVKRKAVDTLFIHPTEIVTADVEVSAWRQYEEIKADKKSYQISDNPNISGTNVSEVLDQIPSVQVDETGSVLLRGDANVQIMIDDRPLKMDAEQRNKFLQQLPAKDIEKVELRTTPGARFDARSTAGIINIVMRRSVGDYLGGSANVNASTAGRRGASISLLYSDSVVNSSLSTGWNRWYESNHSLYERLTPSDSTVRRMNKTVDYTHINNTYYVRPQVDIRLTKADRLSLNSTFNMSPATDNGQGFGNRWGLENEQLQSIRDSSSSDQQASWVDVSLLYKHTISEEGNIRMGLSFSQFSPSHNDNNSSVMRDTLQRVDPNLSLAQTIHSEERHPEINANIDYTNSFFGDLTIESGLKYSSEAHHNSYVAQTFDFERQEYYADSVATLQTNTFVKVAAAYLSTGFKLSHDWSVQAGLRYEYARIGDDDPIKPVAHDYQSLFPDMSLAWEWTSDIHLTAAMNRRVQLPDVEDLNPRMNRVSSTFVFVGNPALRPEFTNSYELGLNANIGAFSLNISPFIRRSSDVLRGSGYLDGALIVNSTQNYKSETSTGLDMQVAFRQRSGLSTRLNLSTHYYQNDGSSVPGDLPIHSNFGSANLNVAYQFTSSFSASTNLRYTGAFKSASEDVSSYFASSLNATVKLIENTLTLNMTLADPLNLQKRTRIKYGEGYQLSSDSKSISCYALCTLSYSFGHQSELEKHGNPGQGVD